MSRRKLKKQITENLVIEARYFGEGLTVHYREAPTKKAAFAMACVERWGMIAGMPDGEDSSGRSKGRLATPEELVDRAIKIADLMFDRLQESGDLVRISDEFFESEEDE